MTKSFFCFLLLFWEVHLLSLGLLTIAKCNLEHPHWLSYFFSNLVIQKATLSILPSHFTKHPTLVVLFFLPLHLNIISLLFFYSFSLSLSLWRKNNYEQTHKPRKPIATTSHRQAYNRHCHPWPHKLELLAKTKPQTRNPHITTTNPTQPQPPTATITETLI